MKYLLDVNVLVAWGWADHVEHGRTVRWIGAARKRKNTTMLTSAIPDRSASDISLRDAPLKAEGLREIQRVAQPGARVTYAAAAEGFGAQAQRLLEFFPNARVLGRTATVGANGIERGVVVIQLQWE